MSVSTAGGYVRSDGPDRRGRGVHVMPLDGDAFGWREGQLAGEHFVQDAAKGVQVSGRSDGAGKGLLGGHVRRGAHCLPGHGELGELPGAQQRGDPEVEHLDDAAGGEEQVAWLDVAVHY